MATKKRIKKTKKRPARVARDFHCMSWGDGTAKCFASKSKARAYAKRTTGERTFVVRATTLLRAERKAEE